MYNLLMKTMSLTNSKQNVSVEFVKVARNTYRMRNTLGEGTTLTEADARERVQTLLGETGRALGWQMDR